MFEQPLVKNIKLMSCPKCNANIEEEKVWLHARGGWHQFRKFRCGLILHYSPGYNMVEEEGECCLCPEWRTRQEKRREAMNEIITKVQSMDIDDEFKKKLIEGVNTASPLALLY